MKTLLIGFLLGLAASLVFAYNGIYDFETEAWVALLASLPFGLELFLGTVQNV